MTPSPQSLTISELRDQINQARREIKRTDPLPNLPMPRVGQDNTEAFHRMLEVLRELLLNPPTFDDPTREALIQHHDKLVTEWNRRAQIQRNEREVKKVRKARCPECFMVHPGECL